MNIPFHLFQKAFIHVIHNKSRIKLTEYYMDKRYLIYGLDGASNPINFLLPVNTYEKTEAEINGVLHGWSEMARSNARR